ncbi:MAG TPA: thiamine phosphate synthase [Polyangiales bacterium]|nr:thiamine phosphate synthase [Polyangiales bacterium]
MRGLYAIIDPEVCRDAPLAVAEAVLRGGCAALQLRAKCLTDAEYLELGREIVSLCRTAGVPFFANDRVDLVVELGADGVHVGQTDLPIEEVRAALGARMMIGVSTHSVEQAKDAERRGAQMIGFGPVFATTSKLDHDPVVGLEGLRVVCGAVRIPVIAIGGITLGNVSDVCVVGAQLAAVISAVCRAEDPEGAARTLHGAWA